MCACIHAECNTLLKPTLPRRGAETGKRVLQLQNLPYEEGITCYSKSDHGLCLLLSVPAAPQNTVTVPLLMPLITLMERQAVVFEGMDVWESNDQSCEIMLKHLATARQIAQNAAMYSSTAERVLEGRKHWQEKLPRINKTSGLHILKGKGSCSSATRKSGNKIFLLFHGS